MTTKEELTTKLIAIGNSVRSVTKGIELITLDQIAEQISNMGEGGMIRVQ